MLQAENLSALWKNNLIFKNINFSISKGDLVALCGPNGAGKSTLLSSICKMPLPNLKISGDIFIDEKNINSFEPKIKAQKIAYLCQNETCVWNHCVFDFVLQGRFCRTNALGIFTKEDKLKCKEILEALKISYLEKKCVNEISGGEFQKVRLARALAQGSDFILLDEPLANLDFIYSVEIMEILKNLCSQKKVAVLISLHDINMALRFAEKFILLKNGSTNFFGSKEDACSIENLKKIYGCNLKTFIHPVYNCIQAVF